MSDTWEKPARLGRLVLKDPDTKEYHLLGFLQKGKYGPELRFVTKEGDSWVPGSALRFEENGVTATKKLPKWAVSIFLDDGVSLGHGPGAEAEEDTDW